MAGRTLPQVIYTATKLFEAGFTDLCSVIPPGAQLSPNSNVKPTQLGKVPGRKGHEGWYGYQFLDGDVQLNDVRAWDKWGANVGVRSRYFPAIDIDCDDEVLAQIVQKVAVGALGPAPVRTSGSPRRLLMYRAQTPFARMALVITHKGKNHVVEVLGKDRQYLAGGTHKSGNAYEWDRELDPANLTYVTGEQVRTWLLSFATQLRQRGIEVETVGDGTVSEKIAVAQPELYAPSIDALRDLVSTIPNSGPVFTDRDIYLDVGYAIKAAAGDNEEEGKAIFLEWCERWDGSVNLELSEADWSRMYPPYRIGWRWLQELASKHTTYNAAVDEFTADPNAVPPEQKLSTPVDNSLLQNTDAWIASKVHAAICDSVRYVPETGHWHVWSGYAWSTDRVNAARNLVWRELIRLSQVAKQIAQAAPTPQERKALTAVASKLQSHSMLQNVLPILQFSPGIAVAADEFDRDLWKINTPVGEVNLRTGVLSGPDPAAMHSKSTAVGPSSAPAPVWTTFLREATGGDPELQSFLQRQAGYFLTGLTTEQTLTFIHGPGGNGKTVFAEALAGAMGDYAQAAAMESFTSSNTDRHPTDLAGLLGSRMVTAEETQIGRKWDEQRIKRITGGGRLRARFMRQDFFEYTPTFKLLIIGNHAPEIQNVDDAMRRRIHIVPFVTKPKTVDHLLSDKLRDEFPQILQWMIEGCLLWQQQGLAPPERVLACTRDFLDDEDAVKQWMEDSCEFVEVGTVSRSDLFRSWQQWCYARGENPGTQAQLKRKLDAKKAELKFVDYQVGPSTRRLRGYRGIKLIEDNMEELL
jgi:P4 family phage/plasmid primase-like protien